MILQTSGKFSALLLCMFVFFCICATLYLWQQRQAMFSYFYKSSWVHAMIYFFFVLQYRLRTRWSQTANIGFQPCPLCTEISPDSLNLLITQCTIDDEIPKFFAICCPNSLSQRGVNHSLSLLLKDSATLGCSFSTQSCYWLTWSTARHFPLCFLSTMWLFQLFFFCKELLSTSSNWTYISKN